MSLLLAQGAPATELTSPQLRELLLTALAKLGPRHRVLAIPPDHTRSASRAGELTGYLHEHYGAALTDVLTALAKLGPRHRVLAIPPDHTRSASRAGELTGYLHEHYGAALTDVLPALGTHAAMTPDQLHRMFGDLPHHLIRIHHWRTDITTLGEVPASFLEEQSEGKLHFPYPAQVNRLLTHGRHDLIVSLGQVVPHEVIGMANGNKNILIGTGGHEGISRSHYLGAVYGMERIMGRADTPVRRVLNYASDRFLQNLPILYILTVISEGKVRGLFIGDDAECFTRAAELSLQVNFQLLDQPIKKAVVYLDPHEFHSTWLGNKAIYRTRMALADDAELLILAPGVHTFGEDPGIDILIRRHGYHGTEATLQAVETDPELKNDLSAAAHLIHGSSEGRFRITYAPGHLTREEIESVGFSYASLAPLLARYNPATLRPGPNTIHGEEVFFIPNPALGLWAHRSRF